MWKNFHSKGKDVDKNGEEHPGKESISMVYYNSFSLYQQASLMSHVARHRLPTSGEKGRKATTNRKVRKDKGQPKKAIAAILSGQLVTNSESKVIMRSLE